MKNITLATAKKLAKEYNIDTSVVPISEFHYGLNAELEHTNITHGNISMTMKIVLVHLKEDPKYYHFLQKQELRRTAYWMNRVKPSIFKST